MPSEKDGVMIILSSPSGAGKTTISKMLLKNDKNILLSISCTTRPKRKGEINKKDYIFISDNDFNKAIKKNLICIKFFKTPNNQTPLFNGASEKMLNHYEKYLENFKVNKKNKKEIIGGIFHAKSKQQVLYFDIGGPPDKNFSKNYQSGPLSFEYFLDGIKIITNCGFGNNLINRVFGNSIKNTFKTSDLEFKIDKNLIGCSASHNGYEKNFNCIHKREVYLDQNNNKLNGVDHIFKKKDGIPIRYVLRFHLNPELSAVKTISGNSALIQISKNKSLIFTIKDENLELEKSIYLGGKKILDNTCITISGNLVNKDKFFNWEIKKKI